MSTFVDPPNPGSFEHNGQRPEADESDLEEDSFDNRVADERRTLADGAVDDDEPAPDERV